jgi:hypothetical protein
MEYSLMKVLLNKILIFIGIIAAIILYVIMDVTVALGFLAGIIVMLINWKMLAWQNEKIVKGEKKPSYAYIFYFFRYAIIAAVLFLSFLFENIEGLATVAGIIFALIYAFIFALFISKKERGNQDE